MTTAVKTLLLDNMLTVLTASLITNVAVDDESRVGTIKLGRFRNAITAVTGGISVEIHGNHLLGPTKEAGKDTAGDRDFSSAWNLPVETVGGSLLRWIRGCVVVQYHFKTQTRDEADTIIEVVAARIRMALSDNSTLIGLEGDFGEMSHTLEVSDNYSYTNEGEKPASGRLFIEWRALISRRRSR